jgi:hypothetical protein
MVCKLLPTCVRLDLREGLHRSGEDLIYPLVDSLYLRRNHLLSLLLLAALALQFRLDLTFFFLLCFLFFCACSRCLETLKKSSHAHA